MRQVQQDIMCVLLQTLLAENRISKEMYNKSRNKILDMPDLPDFFRDNPAGEETAHGSSENPC